MHLVMALVLYVAACAFLSETFMITFVLLTHNSAKKCQKNASVFLVVLLLMLLLGHHGRVSAVTRKRSHAKSTAAEISHFPECSLVAMG